MSTRSSRLKALALPPLASPSGRLKVHFQATSSYDTLPTVSLKTLQSEIETAIQEAIVPGKGGVMAHAAQLPDLRAGVMFRDVDGAYIWQWTIEGELSPIILGAERLVAEHADRVRPCKRCGALFVAVKRQEYCTPEHGQQDRNDRKAERKGGRG
jgi:hypothetical protein